MGVFDHVHCKYPLPIAVPDDTVFQTKDTDEQYLGHYEIREDGTLWHEAFDTVDKSDPNAIGLMRLSGIMAKENKRWEFDAFTGEVAFYHLTDDMWFEFSAYFVKGHLKHLEDLSRKRK